MNRELTEQDLRNIVLVLSLQDQKSKIDDEDCEEVINNIVNSYSKWLVKVDKLYGNN